MRPISPSLLDQSGSSETMPGEKHDGYFQLHSSYLHLSTSSADRITSHKPAEESTGGDDSVRVLVVH